MKKGVIKNESEFKKWVIDNHRKIGFSGIVRKDIGECPDLIMLRNGKEIKIELETMASNFLLHKHDLSKVDEVVCIVKDVDLKIPTMGVEELRFIGSSNRKVTLSIDEDIYNKFQKFCEENAIMLSKVLEMDMKRLMKKKEVIRID